MARAKSTTRSKSALAIEEINQGIEMLRKQVAKVEDLQSEGFPYREAFRARAELQIRESIRRIFGDTSPEFQALQHYKLRTNTPTEVTETLSMLNGLIARLESKKLALLGLGAGEPSADTLQSGTPPNASHPPLVPPAQIPVTPLAPPVAPSLTVSIPLTTNVAASVTATSTASSAQPPAPPQPSVAAAPSNSPPVQPASVAFAPSSTMPPPSSTSTTVPPSASPAQSVQPPLQETKTLPHPSPQPIQAAVPVSSPSTALPGFSSLVQSAASKPHSVRTPALSAASPVFETPLQAAERPPSSPRSITPTPSADTAEAAPTANAPPVIPLRDGSEPAPTTKRRTRPSPTTNPAPGAERLARQPAQPIPSAGRTTGGPDLPRSDATKPTPSDSTVGPDPLDLVRKICTRFHTVVRQLRLRREYRATLDVEDDYDVQDLFYALLRLEFEEVSSEEWIPPYTDYASRTTFFLQREGIAIVVKKTRPGVGAREIADQLRIDAERYAACETCKTLFCFVYDPEGRIGNPRGLEMDLTSVSDRYTVELLIAPK